MIWKSCKNWSKQGINVDGAQGNPMTLVNKVKGVKEIEIFKAMWVDNIHQVMNIRFKEKRGKQCQHLKSS